MNEKERERGTSYSRGERHTSWCRATSETNELNFFLTRVSKCKHSETNILAELFLALSLCEVEWLMWGL
jgi:hypothetical protein